MSDSIIFSTPEESEKHSSVHEHKTTLLTLIVTLGIIFGDIGTSPLYVYKAIALTTPTISSEVILGAFSCIFWTLASLTTCKYVWLLLKADNNGEGGIFALYALVRRRGRWLLWPAIIGGSTLLSEGLITPPISVSSAVEGLRILQPDINTVPIVLCILVFLFGLQWLGTAAVGSVFGWVMLTWFGMLAVLGLSQAIQEPRILLALNPSYAINLILSHPAALSIMGAVFLCTTGAEALYSDLGHCGKKNIRITWSFVMFSLVLNYAGQAAWLIGQQGQAIGTRNPFYEIVPSWFLMPSIVVATAAAIVASQALISGTFTLVAVAMRLNLFPKFTVVYPTELKGQIYVPAINWLLLLGCIGVVLYFGESSNMEAAYGLSITITMLATTILMTNYFILQGKSRLVVFGFLGTYLLIEGTFFVANLLKFFHGGYVAIVVAITMTTMMFIWNRGSRTSHRFTEYLDVEEHLPVLKNLSQDSTIPKYATHLVYMTKSEIPSQIDSNIMYSITKKNPKRADTYWFIHVNVVDEPYALNYKVTTFVDQKVFRIDFELGFRVEPRVGVLFRKVITDLAKNEEVDMLSRYPSLRKNEIRGDFRFVVIERALSYDNAISALDRLMMRAYFALKECGVSTQKNFGLDSSAVNTEVVPLVIAPLKELQLKRRQ